MNGLSRHGVGSSGGGAARRCPSRREWRERIAHRFDERRREPESWGDDLAHLESCDACRDITLELDPTLLFRPLAAPMPDLDEAAEVASMRQAVTALRRAERVERHEDRSWADLPWTPWNRWAAAALVVLSAVSLGAGALRDGLWIRLGHGLPGNRSVVSRSLSEEGGDYGEIAGITTTRTASSEDALLPVRSEPLGSVVEDTLDALPLIEPFEPDALGTGIFGSGIGADTWIWENEKIAVIWVVNSGEIESDLQGV
jgi:hypothetical protein